MPIHKEIFGELNETKDIVYKYTLMNKNRLSLICTNYGATILQIHTPDREGNSDNITICYQTLQDLQDPPGRPYFGALIGRFCNRIEGGQLTLNGHTHSLFINNGPNHLHGGQLGFDRRLWRVVREIDEEGKVGLEFEYISIDGEENYPGNLNVHVTYELTDEDQLNITFHATTDKTTVVNLTNHTYWNLSGNARDKIYDNILHLGASHYLPVSETAIPTGEIRSVKGSPFDFSNPTKFKDQMLQINGGGKPGIDHCFVVDGALDSNGDYVYDPHHSKDYLRFAAKVTDSKSGRTVTTHTTQPGIQIYTANFLAEDSKNHPFIVHNAFCLETQHFPDSPNKPNFPTVTLHPNEVYHHQTTYTFSIE